MGGGGGEKKIHYYCLKIFFIKPFSGGIKSFFRDANDDLMHRQGLEGSPCTTYFDFVINLI